jgi:hypothetical protein
MISQLVGLSGGGGASLCSTQKIFQNSHSMRNYMAFGNEGLVKTNFREKIMKRAWTQLSIILKISEYLHY